MTHHTNTVRLVASSRETTTAGEGGSPALSPATNKGSHHDEDAAVVVGTWPAVRHGDKSTAPYSPFTAKHVEPWRAV
jgi:hypothetical protein